MPETEEIPLSPPEVPKNKKILCVCDNGRSRSKYMARALSNLGYEHARVLGIQDRQITTKEKIAAINEHDIILCASGTTKSMVEKLLQSEGGGTLPEILDLDLSERLHSKLYSLLKGLPTNGDNAEEELLDHLRKLGFK